MVMTFKQLHPFSADKDMDPLHMGGHLLETVPDSLLIEDPPSRTCCGALTCFGSVYCIDIFCMLPTMQQIEHDDRVYDMRLLPFYEACWPCMRCCLCSGLQTAEELRTVSNAAACPWPCCGICNYFFTMIA